MPQETFQITNHNINLLFTATEWVQFIKTKLNELVQFIKLNSIDHCTLVKSPKLSFHSTTLLSTSIVRFSTITNCYGQHWYVISQHSICHVNVINFLTHYESIKLIQYTLKLNGAFVCIHYRLIIKYNNICRLKIRSFTDHSVHLPTCGNKWQSNVEKSMKQGKRGLEERLTELEERN